MLPSLLHNASGASTSLRTIAYRAVESPWKSWRLLTLETRMEVMPKEQSAREADDTQIQPGREGRRGADGPDVAR